jgi:hypothetical protein
MEGTLLARLIIALTRLDDPSKYTGLRRVWCVVLNSIKEWLGLTDHEAIKELMVAWFGPKLTTFDTQISRDMGDVIKGFIGEIPYGEEIAPLVDKALSLPPPFNNIGAGMVIFSWLTNLLQETLEVASFPIKYEIAKVVKPSRPDPLAGMEMYHRGAVSLDSIKAYLYDLGWNEELIQGFLALSQELLDPNTLVELVKRGAISHDVAESILVKHGYNAENAGRILSLTEAIPGAGDLISMAVREAFHPDLARKYGYTSDFPPEFGAWMQKQGYSQEWAMKYWIAHWQLPSIGQAFEMLHRGVISIEDVYVLLRAADVAPYWHDKLTEIAYQPLTRVDVRRMHQLGVVSNEGLLKSYKDLGYNDENARAMAEFTILYNTESEREATKTDILKAYNTGIITQRDAISYLVDLGYTEDWSYYFIAIEDKEREEKLLSSQISSIETLYVAGEITGSRVYERLGGLGLTAKRIDLLIEEWDIARLKKLSRPTKSELERFYREGIIDDDRFKEELSKRAYSGEYIDWYYTDLLHRLAQESIEAEQAAREEAQQIEERVIKTEYDIIRANLDVQIRELQRQKAEDKLLIVLIENELEQVALAKDIIAINLGIAELNKQKAQERLKFVEV